jgi:hypothetical protein
MPPNVSIRHIEVTDVKFCKQVHQEKAMFNERTPHDLATRTSDQETRGTQNKTKTGHKAKHGQDNH